MSELVGSVFSWRSVECMSWLVLFSIEVGRVNELVSSVFS